MLVKSCINCASEVLYQFSQKEFVIILAVFWIWHGLGLLGLSSLDLRCRCTYISSLLEEKHISFEFLCFKIKNSSNVYYVK